MANINKVLYRWKEIIIVTATIRVLLFTFPIILNPQIANLSYSWVQWDGPHYIDIAKNWYQTAGEPALFIVFYPFYPILIWLFHFSANNFQIAAILVPLIFSFAASIALFELVSLDYNKKTALLAVWFLNIFPTSYFLQASYSESIYLTVSLVSIYFFRTNSMFKSSVVGILATMTRVNGIFLLPLLFLETKRPRQILPLFFIPLGFLFYLLINYFTFGEFFYFTKPLASNWYKRLDFPWNGITNLIHSLPPLHNQLAYAYYAELIAIITILLIGIYTLIKIRVSYSIYVFLNLLLFTSTNFIMSTPRYALILFPIFITLGLIKNKFLLTLISIIFLSLLFYLTYLYTQGRWAF